MRNMVHRSLSPEWAFLSQKEHPCLEPNPYLQFPPPGRVQGSSGRPAAHKTSLELPDQTASPPPDRPGPSPQSHASYKRPFIVWVIRHGRPRETTLPSFRHYFSQIGDRVKEKGGSGHISQWRHFKGVHNLETALNFLHKDRG